MRTSFFNSVTAFLLSVTYASAAVAGERIAAAPYTFETIDVPGSRLTSAYGINDIGDIVGTYWHTQRPGQFSFSNGFLLRRGEFTSIEYPNDSDSAEAAYGVNNRDRVVGTYRISRGMSSGFLVDHGLFSTIRTTMFEVQEARGINDAGTIVGVYALPSAPINQQNGSYLLRRGTFSMVNVPGAIMTIARGINNAEDIVGDYYSSDRQQHGYLLRNGSITNIDFPGALMTSPYGINSRGAIAGTLRTADGTHGFVFDNGKFQLIDVPGARITEVFGINSAGRIVGDYQDASGHVHGFVATPLGAVSPGLMASPF